MRRPFRILFVVYIITMILFYLGNNVIVTTFVEISNEKIPFSFNDYTIVQISDLHNKNFGKNQFTLLDKIKNASPDIIVITGDMVYKRSTDISNCLEFINGAVKIAPVYFVTGNHEAQIDYYPYFLKRMTEIGVNVLEDKGIRLYKNNEFIMLWGVNDPEFYYNDKNPLSEEEILEKTLFFMPVNKNDYNILLSHRPHLLRLYSMFNFDLVFTGHAHGGQVIVPFIGPIAAPNQGFTPKYTSGVHTIGNTTEIISRGLGGSIFPLRIFNNPELIVCKLKSLNK